MLNIIELLDGVIRKPADTFKLIAREKPVAWALAVFAAATLLSSVVTDYSSLEELGVHRPNLVIQVVTAVAGLFVITGILYLVSLIFKGSGGFWSLFSALGFVQFPAFLNPLAQLVRIVGGAAGALFGGLISLASGIWVAVLYVIALRESRGITTGASIATFLIVLVLAAVVVAAAVVFAVLVLGPVFF